MNYWFMFQCDAKNCRSQGRANNKAKVIGPEDKAVKFGLASRTTWLYKKLGYRRETARRFVSLNILLTHSRSFEMTLLSRACFKSLLVFHWNYVCMLNYVCMSNRLWDIQRQRMESPWNRWYSVVQGHWKRRCLIDHIGLRLFIGWPL